MKVYHKEFVVMHREMASWCARQEREGWPSPEVKRWATFVKLSLWTLAQNRDNPPVVLAALAEYTAKLAGAIGAALEWVVMESIETGCKIIGGASVLLIGLSFMWVCLLMIFTKHLPDLPITLFIGLFGALAAMLVWAGANLFIKGDIL